MSVSNAYDDLQDQLSPTALEAVKGVANLWPNVQGKQTHECREAVCRCLTLGVSRGDLAFYIRGSVYASVPFMTVNKSQDSLYTRIYARIANIAKAANASTVPKDKNKADPIGEAASASKVTKAANASEEPKRKRRTKAQYDADFRAELERKRESIKKRYAHILAKYDDEIRK